LWFSAVFLLRIISRYLDSRPGKMSSWWLGWPLGGVSGGRGRPVGVSSGRGRPGGVSSGRPRAEDGRVKFTGMYRGRATSNPALDKRRNISTPASNTYN
jgi:hypothetical protein